MVANRVVDVEMQQDELPALVEDPDAPDNDDDDNNDDDADDDNDDDDDDENDPHPCHEQPPVTDKIKV